jgi:hypothetical protein
MAEEFPLEEYSRDFCRELLGTVELGPVEQRMVDMLILCANVSD